MSGRQKSNCTLLDKVDPKFAARMEEACQAHDDGYHGRSKPRLQADMEWIRAAWAVSPWRAVVYGTAVLAGGWFLYYDYDRKIEKAWDATVRYLKNWA